ncbi:MAG: protein kinase [Gemmatales bacterium]
MKRELPLDDVFEKQLAEWEERLEQGEDVAASQLTPESDIRLNRGLACLKQLNNLRRRRNETPTSPLTKVADVDFTPMKYKLPTRFGKFDLQRELGRGGFGVVFLALDRVLQCQVALKVPHSHVLVNDKLRERFQREARVAAGLQHPHIVAVHEAGALGPVHYIVYSYCPGITLAEWMRTQKEQVSAQQAAEWVASLAEAVAYAHSKGVLHRDLKPANILLHDPQDDGSTIESGRPRQGRFTPKITDFGLAKVEREQQDTITGTILGTPQYMAPEQASSKVTASAAVDIHALGVLLYELLAGHPPYRGESDYETLQLVCKQEPLPLRKLRPRLSRDLETICLKCLQKDPALRYGSATELAQDLRRYLSGEPIQARPVSWIERSWRLCRRHPLVSLLVLALLTTMVAGAAGILYQNHHRGLQAEATKAWLTKYLAFLRKNVQDAQDMLKDVRTEKAGRAKLINMLPYYEALLADQQTEPMLQLEAARLANQVGQIHYILGEYAKAVDRYQQSNQLFEQVRKTQRSYPLTLEQANVMTRLASSWRLLRKNAESEKQYQQAILLMKEELTKRPDETSALSFLANALVYNSDNLNSLKRAPIDIEQDLLQAKDYIEKAIGIMPDDDMLLMTKASVIDEMGLHCMRLRRLDESGQYLTQALHLRQQVMERSPKLEGIGVAVARSHWRLGNLSKLNQNIPEARKQYNLSIDLNDRLWKENPEAPTFAHNAAWDRIILCNMLEEIKNISEMEKPLREAIAIRKQCKELHPQHEANQYELVTNMFRLAKLLRDQKRSAESEALYQEATELNERLTTDFPHEIKWQEQYIARLQIMLTRAEAEKKTALIKSLRQRLLKAREKLALAQPEVLVHQRDLDSSYVIVASEYRAEKNWKKAAELMGQLVEVRKQIAASSEAQPRDTLVLAQRYMGWARDLLEVPDRKEAMEKLQEAIRLFQLLQKQGYPMKEIHVDFGNALMQLGYEYVAMGQLNTAHQQFFEALPLREMRYLTQKTAGNANALAKCHYMLFQTYCYQKRDYLSAAWHYGFSSVIDPAYTKPPINVKWLIQMMHLIVMPAKKS